MAAPPAHPQFMTTTDRRTHPDAPLIDNIEYDQIVVPDVSIHFLFCASITQSIRKHDCYLPFRF